MESNILFGGMTFEEVEKFELKTNGKVIFNSIGENAISFQKAENGTITLLIDKVKTNDNSYPNVFLFEPAQIANLYNMLTEIVNENPKTYNLKPI